MKAPLRADEAFDFPARDSVLPASSLEDGFPIPPVSSSTKAPGSVDRSESGNGLRDARAAVPSAPSMTPLWSETRGTGRDLLLLHGWGLHGGIWDELTDDLADTHRVTRLDLPGHGHSPPLAAKPLTPPLEDWAEAVLAAAPPQADWLGWSLGGLIALWAAARHRQRLRRLVLLASTPRFVRGPDWPDAVDPRVFEDFVASLGQSYRPTLLRFLALQTRGSEGAREAQRRLRARLFERGAPDPTAMAQGLAILEDADLRALLRSVTQPVLVIAGGRDTLVPPAAARALVRLLPQGRVIEIGGAGHAPFLSHGVQVARAIRRFLER
jgi:pimeloyl-[acyl-carrier protein] methyl ester esterase